MLKGIENPRPRVGLLFRLLSSPPLRWGLWLWREWRWLAVAATLQKLRAPTEAWGFGAYATPATNLRCEVSGGIGTAEEQYCKARADTLFKQPALAALSDPLAVPSLTLYQTSAAPLIPIDSPDIAHIVDHSHPFKRPEEVEISIDGGRPISVGPLEFAAECRESAFGDGIVGGGYSLAAAGQPGRYRSGT
jgi:hypothetical protein